MIYKIRGDPNPGVGSHFAIILSYSVKHSLDTEQHNRYNNMFIPKFSDNQFFCVVEG